MNPFKKALLVAVGVGLCSVGLPTLAETQEIEAKPAEKMQPMPEKENQDSLFQLKKPEPEKKYKMFKISFDKKTKKKPELENVSIKGQLYKNGTPIKRFQTKTNEPGEFYFEKDYGRSLAISLHYIEGEEKLKVKCNGYARPGKTEVLVNCH